MELFQEHLKRRGKKEVKNLQDIANSNAICDSKTI